MSDSHVAAARSENDRLAKKSRFGEFVKRPEIGAFSGMIVLLVFLWIVAGDVVYNPLGIKNNLAIISQLGIIATGACLLMIAGEFDLSIGSMIGFAGMCMAMLMKWGLPFGLGEATPAMAFLITLALTLSIGCLIGNIVVRRVQRGLHPDLRLAGLQADRLGRLPVRRRQLQMAIPVLLRHRLEREPQGRALGAGLRRQGGVVDGHRLPRLHRPLAHPARQLDLRHGRQ
jgi:hypothetical protein